MLNITANIFLNFEWYKQFNLKDGQKWRWEIFEGLKNQRKIIGGLKWKVWPFIGSTHIFNPKENLQPEFDFDNFLLI